MPNIQSSINQMLQLGALASQLPAGQDIKANRLDKKKVKTIVGQQKEMQRLAGQELRDLSMQGAPKEAINQAKERHLHRMATTNQELASTTQDLYRRTGDSGWLRSMVDAQHGADYASRSIDRLTNPGPTMEQANSQMAQMQAQQNAQKAALAERRKFVNTWGDKYLLGRKAFKKLSPEEQDEFARQQTEGFKD